MVLERVSSREQTSVKGAIRTVIGRDQETGDGEEDAIGNGAIGVSPEAS